MFKFLKEKPFSKECLLKSRVLLDYKRSARVLRYVLENTEKIAFATLIIAIDLNPIHQIHIFYMKKLQSYIDHILYTTGPVMLTQTYIDHEPKK